MIEVITFTCRSMQRDSYDVLILSLCKHISEDPHHDLCTQSIRGSIIPYFLSVVLLIFPAVNLLVYNFLQFLEIFLLAVAQLKRVKDFFCLKFIQNPAPKMMASSCSIQKTLLFVSWSITLLLFCLAVIFVFLIFFPDCLTSFHVINSSMTFSHKAEWRSFHASFKYHVNSCPSSPAPSDFTSDVYCLINY